MNSNDHNIFKEAYQSIGEKTVKQVKFTDMSSKPTKVILAKKESDLDSKDMVEIFNRVMKTGEFVEVGKLVAEPLYEAKKYDFRAKAIILQAMKNADVFGAGRLAYVRDALRDAGYSFSESELESLVFSLGKHESMDEGMRRRIRLPKLSDPIVPEAIKLLAKVKQAVKYTNRTKFKWELDNNRYFSASHSWAYQSYMDMEKARKDTNSIIVKDVGDLVAVWDDKQNIGYIVPNDAIYQESSVNEKYNSKDYVAYVVVNGKIESGWEYPEDAKDQLGELPTGKKGKVYKKAGLKALGLDPENDKDWLSGKMESIREASDQNQFNLYTTNPNELYRQLKKSRGIISVGKPRSAGHGLSYIWVNTTMTKDDLENDFDLIQQVSLESIREAKAGQMIKNTKMKIKNLGDLKHFIVRSFSITGKEKKDPDELKAMDDVMQAGGWQQVKKILDDNYWDQKSIMELYSALINFQFEGRERFFGNDIREAADPIIIKTAEVIRGHVLMGIRKNLEKVFNKKDIDFSFSPYPHYRIKTKGKTIVIVNKQYADSPDMVVDDMAIGYM